MPNLEWDAITLEALRDLPDFKALPEVQNVVLSAPNTYRQVLQALTLGPAASISAKSGHPDQSADSDCSCRDVRQDTDLWDDLHSGVCTTGILNAALGLYEPSACRRLGMPSSYASHYKLLGAYERLHQSVYVPPLRVPAQRGSELSHAQAGMHCSFTCMHMRLKPDLHLKLWRPDCSYASYRALTASAEPLASLLGITSLCLKLLRCRRIHDQSGCIVGLVNLAMQRCTQTAQCVSSAQNDQVLLAEEGTHAAAFTGEGAARCD